MITTLSRRSLQTDAALARIQTLLASNEAAVGVRVGVKTRGCNGYSFTLNYAEEAQAGDEVVEEQGTDPVR